MGEKEFISVWVRDPRICKEDFWHAYMDYEICIHTNSLAFNRKSSCVRRRFSEFVWLRQKLQENTLLLVNLPQLPPKNPFFSLNNGQQINTRMKGLQQFLQTVVLNPLLLSDSCLHLFLQSQLSVPHMEACAEGRGGVTVTQAIHSSALSRLRFGPEQEEDLREDHQEQEEDLREDHQEQEEDLKEDHLVIGRSEREPAGVRASDVE
ncbi:hypothetical protein AALO_G00181270 [Alosa alosa]|uniref:PX domain-containing protein n=1 Tax=Alosa alosa TaxID=278164 RepID=A0AAV6G8U5_9TELE|nr:sorting nexin-10B [Alosa alosa]KAG5271548.1 hypothetical protein AALO_G00181270 [Alosa alosa]